MKYMLMLFEDETPYGPNKDTPTMRDMIAKHGEFIQHVGDARVGGAPLKASTTATTVRRTNGGHTIHDGPYAESKEQLGGFYLIDVPDLDAALAIARRMPFVKDGAVEVRPVLSLE